MAGRLHVGQADDDEGRRLVRVDDISHEGLRGLLREEGVSTDHASHQEQASMIRRYIMWRNNHAYDERLRRIVDRANVA